jgi:hypothetical protein
MGKLLSPGGIAIKMTNFAACISKERFNYSASERAIHACSGAISHTLDHSKMRLLARLAKRVIYTPSPRVAKNVVVNTASFSQPWGLDKLRRSLDVSFASCADILLWALADSSIFL